MTPWRTALAAAGAACLCAAAAATTVPAAEPEAGPPQRVAVTGHHDNAIGTSDAASQGVIRAELLTSRPALRPARRRPWPTAMCTRPNHAACG